MRHTFDPEKVTYNLCRLKKNGLTFEINIDPDKAMEYIEGSKVDIEEILKAQKIFFDAKDGKIAPENNLYSVFGTTDVIKIAKEMLDSGSLQLTAEFRHRVRERKRRKVLEIIRRDAIDPKTQLPHPLVRIENAFEEAKVHIDEYRTAEAQVRDIIKKLRMILPLKFGRAYLAMTFSSEYAGKAYGLVKGLGNITKDEWKNDGSWLVEIDVPVGMQQDVIDKINDLTKGEVECKIIRIE